MFYIIIIITVSIMMMKIIHFLEELKYIYYLRQFCQA
jgi:hypothetical protein